MTLGSCVFNLSLRCCVVLSYFSCVCDCVSGSITDAEREWYRPG